MKRQGRIGALALGLTMLAAGAQAQLSPAHAQIGVLLGLGNARQAELEASAALAAGGLSSGEQNLLLVDRATAREIQGRHDEALIDLTRAISAHALAAAEQAHAMFVRGTVLDAMGRTDAAIGDYSAALAVQPRFAPALNNRANAYRRQDRMAAAKRDYLASLAAGNLQPEYSYFGLGQIAEAAGNLAGARSFYNQALAANPNYASAMERLTALGDRAAGDDDGIIHLRPPKSFQAAAAPPAPKPIAAGWTKAPQVVPASYPGARAEPGLRPALDTAAKNEAAKGEAAKSKDSGKGEQVQLGAWRSEDEAGQGWNRAQKRSGGLLGGLSPHIVAVDLPGKGRYYRLRVGPAAGGPIKFCAALETQGVNCIPARD